MASFLDKQLSQEQLDKLTEHLRFENFEKNESVNNEFGKKIGIMNLDGKFIRKGNCEISLSIKNTNVQHNFVNFR